MFDFSILPQPLIRYGVGLWRWRWVVVILAWLTALAAWAGIWLIPDRYQSRAQIFVQTDNILEPVMSDVTARPDYERRVEVMQRALLTRPNIERVIFRSGMDSLIEAESPRDQRVAIEEMIDWVLPKIEIESPQLMFFDIRFQFSEPVLASNVVDAILDLFIEQDLGASLQENEDAKQKLEREIARFEERLAAKDQEVADFRRDKAEELAIISGNQRKRDLLELALTTVGNDLAVARRQVDSLSSRLASTPRTTSGDELDKLKIQLAQLRSQYQDGYPDIRVLEARIAELEASGVGVLPDNPEYRRVREQLRTAQDQVAGLEEREAALREEEEILAFTTAQAPQVEADLQRIIRDYEQTQKSYEELVQSRDRLELTTVLGPGAQGVKYQVLERPRPALKPVSPPRLVLIVASVFFAFGVGVAGALLITFLDKSFTQTAEVQSAFGLPVLGALSEVHSDIVREKSRKDLTRLAGAGAALFALGAAYVYWEVYRVPAAALEPRPAGEAILNEAHKTTPNLAKAVSKGDRTWD